MNATANDANRPSEASPLPQTTPKHSLARRLFSGLGVLLVASVMVSLAATGIAVLHIRADAEPARQPSPPVSVATIRAEVLDSYQRTVSYTGRLEAARQTQLAFERAGTVIAVNFDEGDKIPAGAVVARLDTAQLKTVRRQLEARKRELEAQRELARLTLKRQSKLKRGGWSPEQRIDEAAAALAQLTASVDQVAAQLAANAIDLQKSELIAPYAGTVGQRSIDEGAIVSPGTPVLALIETGRLQARIGLPPDAATRLRPDGKYALRMGTTSLAANLAAVRPDLATGTRTVTVIFDVATKPHGLKLGDLVTFEMKTTVRENGAWVPLAALKEGSRGLWTVLVVDRSETAPIVRAEAVELLHAEADRAYVRGTFTPGAHVLSGGTDRVVNGQRVALASEQGR
jgi:membrane fusion protein, multidrug efflux system